MSINKENNMGNPLFQEFKKQASFYVKEKIKTARLALTDVTPAQLLTEEATSANQSPPDARSMTIISRAAFEVDDYWRIVDILHSRLSRFEKMNWRVSYKALLVLEHLLTHGPESVAEEFQTDRDVIHEMESFQYIDQQGFNWGLTVRNKSERVNRLLQRGPLLKEERDRARKISLGIQGFGSFCNRSSTQAQDSPVQSFDRCNSNLSDHAQRYEFLIYKDEREQIANAGTNLARTQGLNRIECYESKENLPGECIESECKKGTVGGTNENHPFNDDERYDSSASLLSTQV